MRSPTTSDPEPAGGRPPAPATHGAAGQDELVFGRHGRDFVLDARVWLARPLDAVFPFFADAGNLDALTPPWLHFRILTPLPIEMREEATIDYRLRLHGVPVRWRTEITEYQPPHRFVDVQRRGPYTLWRHEHRFSPVAGGTLVEDHVRYRIWGGRIVHALLVQGDLERVFRYRRQQVRCRFGSTGV
jgi:ligand-binding SRPBCC domain-containing protein